MNGIQLRNILNKMREEQIKAPIYVSINGLPVEAEKIEYEKLDPNEVMDGEASERIYIS